MRAGKPIGLGKSLEGSALIPFSTDLALLPHLSPLVFSSLIKHCCFVWTKTTEKNPRLCDLNFCPSLSSSRYSDLSLHQWSKRYLYLLQIFPVSLSPPQAPSDMPFYLAFCFWHASSPRDFAYSLTAT